MTELPKWLVDHITTTTGAPPGAGRLVRRRCARCRAVVLVGLDDSFAAFTVVIDPEPIQAPAQEDRVRGEGRRSYALRSRDRRLSLQPRDQWMRARSPAGSQPREGPLRYLVVAEHACREGT